MGRSFFENALWLEEEGQSSGWRGIMNVDLERERGEVEGRGENTERG